MTLSRSTLAVALLAALAAPIAHAEIAIDSIGGSDVSFEGLVQADADWFNNDVANLNGDVSDGADYDNELRRAELVLKGKGPGNYEWVLGWDAKANKWLDANVKYKLGGDSNQFIQVGQFKQPNSLEELSSTKNNDFISKAVTTNTFAIARRTGVAYRYATANWGITGSYFGRELTRNLGAGAGFGFRGNWAPINEAGNILHLGLSYVSLDTDADQIRIRARPDADLTPTRLVDTGSTGIRNADRQSTWGAEGMWVHSAFKVQAEYMQSTIDRYNTGFASQPGKSFKGDSWYVSGVWNLSGETWGYKDGVPTTPLPSEPGRGMWQIGARYDKIDLDDGSLQPGATPTSAPIVDGILGGEMDTWTVGVNYYWRSNFKVMLNYVKVKSTKYSSTAQNFIDDDPDIIEARVQFYW
ncbi:MAG: OprO/OprP family phosphate-selective porin [Luteimonas sp.]